MKKKVISESVAENRRAFLDALRSGEYPKGIFIAGQDEPPPGATGFCAVGLAYTVILKNKGPVLGLLKALDITKADLYPIQREWNDTPLTFPQIADLVEHRIFRARESEPMK